MNHNQQIPLKHQVELLPHSMMETIFLKQPLKRRRKRRRRRLKKLLKVMPSISTLKWLN
jgi:hypothetical protein